MVVVTKRFQGQRQRGRFLFGKHDGYLAFSGAVDASVGAVGLPTIEIRLCCFFQALETFSLQGSLGVSDSTLDFAFAM
jgi:hypothetical protein